MLARVLILTLTFSASALQIKNKESVGVSGRQLLNQWASVTCDFCDDIKANCHTGCDVFSGIGRESCNAGCHTNWRASSERKCSANCKKIDAIGKVSDKIVDSRSDAINAWPDAVKAQKITDTADKAIAVEQQAGGLTGVIDECAPYYGVGASYTPSGDGSNYGGMIPSIGDSANYVKDGIVCGKATVIKKVKNFPKEYLADSNYCSGVSFFVLDLFGLCDHVGNAASAYSAVFGPGR